MASVSSVSLVVGKRLKSELVIRISGIGYLFIDDIIYISLRQRS